MLANMASFLTICLSVTILVVNLIAHGATVLVGEGATSFIFEMPLMLLALTSITEAIVHRVRKKEWDTKNGPFLEALLVFALWALILGDIGRFTIFAECEAHAGCRKDIKVGVSVASVNIRYRHGQAVVFATKFVVDSILSMALYRHYR